MIVQYGVQCFDNPNFSTSPSETRAAVVCLVFARSEDQAIERAKKYITRDNYKVIHIQEFKNPHDEIDNLRKQPWEKDE